MFNWRASAMLDYLESMIVNGTLGKDIVKVMHKYKAWLKDEVND